ncbi:PLP-dependent aminotransferase family protein [Flavobacterium sp. NKUCC04_CG]|uniref:MocR-like pyridoxine biosynthesis transcription factor PdxR n=1 Tax=Flavobacterium sp. NKUCC04_CG TaxID=2842121 RepID=UPI001C5ADDDA|nr:PLP-dependent aminotransferase family protein [Flavobacterium sp. NKUCC04_CG]MBW3520310.1 PLP-dependent aminotransferase family protein [Flavobacterium sp. NKUCC04_CG]
MLRPWKLEIRIDKQLDKAIYLQIADAIITDIQIGRLEVGSVLPGSRSMAADLGVNRNTVVEALNVLINEGWLSSKERKGTFVSDVLPVLSKQSTGLIGVTGPIIEREYYQVSFDDGHPDSQIAPVAALARAYRQIFNRKSKWQMMGYANEFGDVQFRKAIANMLNHQRGMHIDEQQMCVTRGSQMAMYLTAQCLLSSNDYVMIEHPGYKPAWKAFESSGATLLTVGVDQDGLVIDDVLRHLNTYDHIKAIYITPHHQYPTTVTLSLQRRLELIRLSNAYGFTIIEDDYDNEFHFGYRPILPLSSYSELENYVYIGTMSKVVAPALRIGYLVSKNESLIKKIGALRKIIDVQGDTIMEQAVLQLIEDGTIKRHLKKAQAYYKDKRNFTNGLLEKHLKGKVDYMIPEGGMAFWIVPKTDVDWEGVDKQLRLRSVKIILPEAYCLDKPVKGMRLSYGSLTKAQLEFGIVQLAEALS